MPEPTSTSDYRKYPKGPNFLLVVILSGVALLLIFIGAYLLLSGKGAKFLPRSHRRDAEPTSYLVRPAANPSFAVDA